jgi:redox-sensitive bicupin YhaK (pirin superfamily)
MNPARKAYVHLVRGQLTVNGHTLHAGDALRMQGVSVLSFNGGQSAEVLVFDLEP